MKKRPFVWTLFLMPLVDRCFSFPTKDTTNNIAKKSEINSKKLNPKLNSRKIPPRNGPVKLPKLKKIPHKSSPSATDASVLNRTYTKCQAKKLNLQKVPQ